MSYLYIESLWGGVAMRVDIIQPILKGIIDEISCDHTYKGMPDPQRFPITPIFLSYKLGNVIFCCAGVPVEFRGRERGIEFCRSRKIISVECLRRDWQLVGS